ncbi:hypothetical protein KIW84_065959 [Lathyrus oleraceus]|uniref:Retroviral polymerase SH3-like domain-containing protein n=1 Tax=Pisum sativum TaxID=3888 RepID=A0A9D4WGH3_PEA|nr:hypothetical protein KIW84_065959 [Pisum sativum]
MAKDETIFKSIDECVKVKVRLRNDNMVESKDKGTIMTDTNKGVKRHKVEDKIIQGIFLGYNKISKGYHVYNLQTKKIIINRDVEVDENVSWNWDEEKMEKTILILTELPQEEAEEEDPNKPPSPPPQEKE